VPGLHSGIIHDFVTRLTKALTEVHVLEPHWIESLVEPTQTVPYLLPKQQKRACWLIDFSRGVQVST
jgi:hypothetical protein